MERICSVEGCPRPVHFVTIALCNVHYQRQRRHGDPTAGRPMFASAEQRFMAKVDIDSASGCWLWTAGRDKDGYGKFKSEGRSWRAHRWLYERCVGRPIAAEDVLDHFVCDTPSCVNPDHLRPETPAANVMRSPKFGSSRTHCKRGHEFTDSNTRYFTTPRGHQGRECRACKRVRSFAGGQGGYTGVGSAQGA